MEPEIGRMHYTVHDNDNLGLIEYTSLSTYAEHYAADFYQCALFVAF